MLASSYLRTADGATLFWPSAGIGYAVAVRYGLRWVVIVPTATLLYNLLLAPVPETFLVYSLASKTAATLLAGWFVLHNRQLRLCTHDALLLLRGAILLSVTSGAIGAFGLVEAGLIAAGGFAHAFALWTLGDLLGITALTPALLLLWKPGAQHPHLSPSYDMARKHERGAWLLVLAASFAVVYGAGRSDSIYPLGLITLPLVVLLWSSIRFSPVWTALATLATVSYLSLVAGTGLGGFTPPATLLDTVVLLLLLNLIAVIPVMLSLAGLEQRTTAMALHRRANEDELTGLLNRTAFEEQVRERLARDTEAATLLYVDLDSFKLVNDSASHVAGDALISALSSAIADKLGAGSLLARTGGDEFAIWLPTGRADAVIQARRLLAEIDALRLPWEGQVLTTTASIGVVPVAAGNRDFDSLFSHADAACFAAKELGGNRLYVADTGSDETRSRSAAMQAAMRVREALEHRQFVLFCQPIVPLHGEDGDGVHFEVLLRWRQGDGSLHAPAEFIAAAERFRLGPRLDRYVIDAALAWMEAHPVAARRTLSCGLNISGTTLVDEDFADYLGARLRRSAFPAERICLEITETSVVRDRSRAQRFINQMRELGCRFALDDFGTGFCSFSYLRDLDVDFLKIDGSFVRDLDDSGLSQAVVRSIADIAHVLGKQTIAEQVETDAQRVRMQLMGVDYGQGYFFSRPRAIDEYFAMPAAAAAGGISAA